MSTLTILATFLVCLSLAMCSGSKEENMDGQSLSETTPPADTSAMPPVPSPPIPVAPGSALITATIINTEAVDGDIHCTLKVDRVHRYGSTTPPIPVGSEIKALVSTQVIDTINGSASFDTLMAPQSTREVTLMYAGMAKMVGSNALDWQVASVKP